MTPEQSQYLRHEFESQIKWHRDQAKVLARAQARDDDERRDNRERSEAAIWRAEVWSEALLVLEMAKLI